MEAAMSSLPHPRPRAHLPPHLEALELRDCNAADTRPAQDADAFADDALTEAEIDALFVAEMERRDRLAVCPAGYRDASCEACGCALYVPIGQAGDILCPQCWREGEAIAAGEAAVATDGDDDPRPPAAGAMHPEYAEFAATAAHMLNDDLCAAIGVADAEPAQLRLDEVQRAAFVAAMSAEVVRRLDRRVAA
jgi:uncharacterized Zn finger protein (UPF0148 family)